MIIYWKNNINAYAKASTVFAIKGVLRTYIVKEGAAPPATTNGFPFFFGIDE